MNKSVVALIVVIVALIGGFLAIKKPWVEEENVRVDVIDDVNTVTYPNYEPIEGEPENVGVYVFNPNDTIHYLGEYRWIDNLNVEKISDGATYFKAKGMVNENLIEAEYDVDESRVCVGYPNHGVAPRFMDDSVAVIVENRVNYQVLHAHYKGSLPE